MKTIAFTLITSLVLFSCTSKDKPTSDPVEFVIQNHIDTVWVEDLETTTMIEIIVESQDTIFLK